MKIFRVVFFTVAIMFAVEIGLEVRAIGRGYSTLLFGEPERDSSIGEAEESNFGPNEKFPFRSKIVSEQKGSLTRLWISSSSFGQDIYIAPDKIFPNLLQKELAKLGLDVEVLNASWAGHDIPRNTIYLQNEGPRWKPDIAILYQMTLEIDKITRISVKGNIDSYLLTKDLVPGMMLDNSGKENFLVKSYEKTTIFKTLKEFIGSRVSQQRILLDNLDPKSTMLFRQFVIQYIESAESQGVEPILCTFAVSHNVEDLHNFPLKYKNALFRYNIDLSIIGWLNTVSDFNNVLREIAKEKEIGIIDIEKEIGGRPVFFRDFAHLSQEGHKELAKQLALGLETRLKAIQTNYQEMGN